MISPAYTPLYDELHNRPFPMLESPCSVSYFVLLREHEAKVAEFLERIDAGGEAFAAYASHVSLEVRGIELRVQKHHDFISLAFFRSGATHGFEEEAVAPFREEIATLWHGLCLCHVEIRLEHHQTPPQDKQEARRSFGSERLIAARVADCQATVWTPYRLDEKGRMRFLIQEHGLMSCRAGRLVQRLLEVETYRMLFLLPLPLAREVGREIRGIGQRFGDEIELLDDIDTPPEQEQLLDSLTDLAMRNERLVARTNYRLHASEAYYRIFQDRLAEMRQEKVAGFQTLSEFLDRRMVPAYRTCVSVRDRLERMGRRLNRAVDLLRTRIDVQLEKQNQQILESLDHRAKLQLRMQQTVEGISVVAISYYAIGLIKVLLEGVDGAGTSFDVEWAAMIVLPFLVLLVWFGTRRIHDRLQRSARQTDPRRQLVPETPPA